MKYSLIIRDAPKEGDRTYEAIRELAPEFLVLSLDLGGRLNARSGRLNYQHDSHLVSDKLDLLSKHPSVGRVHSFSLFVPSFHVSKLKSIAFVEERLLPLFKFPARVDTIYIDLGINPDYSGVPEMVKSIFDIADHHQMGGEAISIGLVAPLSSWLEQDGVLRKLQSEQFVMACPFAESKPLNEQFEKAAMLLGKPIHFFISTIYQLDKINISNVLLQNDYLDAVIFWSPFSLDRFDVIRKQVEVEVEEPDIIIVKARQVCALRKSPSLVAALKRHIEEGEMVRLSTNMIDKDGVIFAEVLGDRDNTLGYVIFSQAGEAYFEKEETTHEQSKSHGRKDSLGGVS